MDWDFRSCGFGQFLVRVFGFCILKLQFFGFGVLRGLRVFSNLVFGFRFLTTMIAVSAVSVLDFSFQCIQYGFSSLFKEATPCKN